MYLSFIYSTNYIWSSFNFTISSIIFRPTSSNGWFYPLSLLLIPAHMSQLQHIETFFFPPLQYCSINNYKKPLIFAQPFHNTCTTVVKPTKFKLVHYIYTHPKKIKKSNPVIKLVIKMFQLIIFCNISLILFATQRSKKKFINLLKKCLFFWFWWVICLLFSRICWVFNHTRCYSFKPPSNNQAWQLCCSC